VLETPDADSYIVTVLTEARARQVADRLAGRGYRLVAVQATDDGRRHGRPPLRPQYTGWWDAIGVVVDPPLPAAQSQTAQRRETWAVWTIGRDHGGYTWGPGSVEPDSIRSGPTLAGLVHQLPAARADELRRAALAEPAAPQRPAHAPPLRYRPGADPDHLRVVDDVVQRVAPEENLPRPWHVDDVEEMLGELFNATLHQDTCDEYTASMVPLYVALAVERRLSDYYRAWALLDLYSIATVGRRGLCADAEPPHVRGWQRTEERPEETAAREAVAAALPDLAARVRDEAPLTRFALAALAAACPEAVDLRWLIADMARRDAGTDRAVVVALMGALADRDPVAAAAAIADGTWNPYLLQSADNPHADPVYCGLSVLAGALAAEIDRAAAEPAG
jgi:hypothetical protein